MEKPWITERGSFSEEVTASYLKNHAREYGYFIMFLTDGMRSGKAAQIESCFVDLPYVLELRLFDEKHEFWLSRSMLGQSFSWRIADDGILNAELQKHGCTGYFADPAKFRYEQLQKLDIADYPEGQPFLSGNRLIRTTGGGIYELPIKTEDAVLLVSYISYDDQNGCAKRVDFRLKEFTHMRPGKEMK